MWPFPWRLRNRQNCAVPDPQSLGYRIDALKKRTSIESRFAWAVGMATCVAFTACYTDPESGTSKSFPLAGPNLLIVSIDTTRADHLSCFGYGRETSPNLDALASNGHLFTNALTVMPTTLPSHAAIFTSQYPHEIGTLANGKVVPPTAYTLAERLSENGFSTAAFVSAAVLDPRFGLDQGFAYYDHPVGPERSGEETSDLATAWLRQNDNERFFCFVHLFDPHTWYSPPEPYRQIYEVPPGSHPPDRKFVRDPALLTPAVCRGAINAYDAEIRYADAQLGTLLQTLETLDLRESTLVVVLSDHGETLDELIETFGYAFDHGEFLYRRELRIPLVLWTPSELGLPTSSVQDELVTTLDLMPTLLALLGIPCEEPTEGRSLVPLLLGGSSTTRPAFARRRQLTEAEVKRPPSRLLQGAEISVTTLTWHFLRCEGRPDELFDIANDPLEKHNVAEAHPDVVGRMQHLIDVRQTADQTGRSRADGTIDPELKEALRTLGYVIDSPNS